jgi:hypothetical protein
VRASRSQKSHRGFRFWGASLVLNVLFIRHVCLTSEQSTVLPDRC